jgi:hypothetical protein
MILVRLPLLLLSFALIPVGILSLSPELILAGALLLLLANSL